MFIVLFLFVVGVSSAIGRTHECRLKFTGSIKLPIVECGIVLCRCRSCIVENTMEFALLIQLFNIIDLASLRLQQQKFELILLP